MDPRYLITSLTQLRPPLVFLGLGLFLTFPHVGDVIAGTRLGVPVPVVKRMCGWMQFPDPGDASGDLYGCVDLVLGIAGGLVDEDRSQGRIARESECAAAHGGTVGEPTKAT